MRSVLVLAMLTACAPAQVRTGSFADSLARMFSAEVREADARLVTLTSELGKLPSLDHANQGPRYGFHSETLFDQEEPQVVQIDLQNHYLVDAVVLVAADVVLPASPGEGYGFPLRFKIEVANAPDMSDAAVIVDQTKADFPNPGRFPLVYEQPGREARYVRFTSTKHWPAPDGTFVWALGEIMVLSGNSNVAIHRPQQATGSMTLAPNWTLSAVNDGLSIVGLPESTAPSPTDGYRSSPAETDDGAPRWVTVDLGAPMPLDEVRLIPAWPSSYGDEPGMGYPRSFRVLLSNDSEFRKDVIVLEDTTTATTPAINPGNNPHTVRVTGPRGRFLRVEAGRLWRRGELRVFALSEVQALVADQNVALGKEVTTNDEAEGPDYARWSPDFLVDGFSSQHELIPWPHYLRALVERGALERELEEVGAARDAKARHVSDTVIMTGSGVGGLAVVALLVVVARHRAVRERDQARLREQIAHDLHDELGSNLGSISLLSELGSRLDDLPDEARADFSEIHRTAERSAEAMRDIVWLVDSGSSTLRELVAKMREAAERLAGDKLSLRVAPDEVADCELPLLFRRHVLFSFKETLNNVRRHAAAETVDVAIDCRGGMLRFTVQDDGVGFRVDERVGLGHGLRNLMRRAQRLKGQCDIVSRPEGGTTIKFEAPLKTRIHGGTYGPKDARLAG